jgi:undecaprenyl pyrophosphate phosphatase UppP
MAMREAQLWSFPFQRPLSWMFGEVTLSSSHSQFSVGAVHETAMSIAKACTFVSAVIFIRILRQVAEVTRFQIVAVHHVVSGSYAAAFRGGGGAHSPRLATPVAFVAASPTLHA